MISKWEDKEFLKVYKKEWYKNNKNEIKLYMKEYNKRPDVKNRAKIIRDLPENKLKRKLYNQRPERKLKDKRYNQQPEVKARIKKYEQRPDVKKRRNKWQKEYRKKPESKIKINKYHIQRRQTDKEFNLIHNLRVHFHKAMQMYSTKGKKMQSNKYGINFISIIKKLGEKPDDKLVYEADHIIPLSLFNHNDPEQIKKAWAPENFQWLTKEINMWKGNRLIKPLTNEEKEKLQIELMKKN